MDKPDSRCQTAAMRHYRTCGSERTYPIDRASFRHIDLSDTQLEAPEAEAIATEYAFCLEFLNRNEGRGEVPVNRITLPEIERYERFLCRAALLG